MDTTKEIINAIVPAQNIAIKYRSVVLGFLKQQQQQ